MSNLLCQPCPAPAAVADVFAFQADGTVQAITSDGTVAWTADLSQGGYCCQPAVPDFQGGLVVVSSDPNTDVSSIYKLDGITGQPYPAYTPPPNPDGTSPGLGGVAVHPDGTIFAIQSPDEYAVPESVIGIDPTTGAQKFSIQLPMEAPGPPLWGDGATQIYGIIIAGDGYAYVPYGIREMEIPETNHLRLLRVDSSGAYDNMNVYDWTGVTSDLFPLVDLSMITNADQGILFTWADQELDNDFWSPKMALTMGAGATLVSAPQPPGVESVFPILQAQDGSFVGTYLDADTGTNYMVAFDATGSTRWIVPNETPQIATADGGVIGQSGITYDQNGNATGMMARLPTQSWTGNEYASSGVVSSISVPPVFSDGADFWPQVGGNPSGNGTAFPQCPCLLQSAGTGSTGPPAEPAITMAAGRRTPQPEASGSPAKTYVILEGDPGLNLPGHVPHNVGNLFHLAAGTQEDALNALGNSAGSPRRVSSVQDIEAQLIGNGPITGGVIYFGHGAQQPYTDGTWSSVLAPGEQAGPNTNVSPQNVNLLKNTEMDTAATVTLHACFAGFGSGRYSIAQLIANRLQRRVYAPTAGTFFSVDPNSHLNGATAPKLPDNVQKPIYQLQDNGVPPSTFWPAIM
ncbi:MAG: hypothetical protein ACLQPN_08645 [Bryobacteraceae bacterium]